MRQALPRVPKDRIAVLIGASGSTAKSLRYSAGCKELNIDSVSGDVEVVWGEVGSYDPIKAMKLPNVIKAIGRGMAPKAALRLFEDQNFFEMVDLRDYVGKRSNQQRRIRSRIIGSQGKIRKLTPRECLRLMGFPDNFKQVVSDTQLYRQTGNSIVVNIIVALLKEMDITKFSKN